MNIQIIKAPQWCFFHSLIALFSLILSGCSSFDPYRLTTRSEWPQPHVPVPNISLSGKLSEQTKREAVDAVWTVVNERYYDEKFAGVDWVAARREHEPLIMSQSNDDDFWRALDKMTGVLKDSHTRVHSPQDIANQNANRGVGLGMGLKRIDGKLVVTRVSSDSDAYFAGIRPGMVVAKINDQPALDHLQSTFLLTRDTSTESAKWRRAISRITQGKLNDSTLVQVERFNSSSGQPNDLISTILKNRESIVAPRFQSRVLPSGFGYIAFSGWVGSFTARAQRAITEHKDAPGIIFDLRDNGGGSADMVRNLLNRFVTQPTKLGRTNTRNSEPVSIAWGVYKLTENEPVLKPSSPIVTKPIVVLVNEGSASASELFAAALQDLKLATVIGEKTCGCLLAYFGYQALPGGGAMAYSELNFVRPDGSRVENVGVTPNIVVSTTVDDIRADRDRVLERAVAHLIELSNSNTKVAIESADKPQR